MSEPTIVEKHIETWITVYELVDQITVSRCALRTCPAIRVRQWEAQRFVTTIFPNGDMEMRPS